MKPLLFSITVLLIICTGCNKDNDNNINKAEVLTQSPWKFSDAGIDNDRNGSIDNSIASSIDACLKDNIIVFNTNLTGTVDESTNVCAGASQTTPFNWNFTNNENSLNISGNAIAGLSGTFKINTLSSSKLSLAKDTTAMGFTVSFVVDFIH